MCGDDDDDDDVGDDTNNAANADSRSKYRRYILCYYEIFEIGDV